MQAHIQIESLQAFISPVSAVHLLIRVVSSRSLCAAVPSARRESTGNRKHMGISTLFVILIREKKILFRISFF